MKKRITALSQIPADLVEALRVVEREGALELEFEEPRIAFNQVMRLRQAIRLVRECLPDSELGLIAETATVIHDPENRRKVRVGLFVQKKAETAMWRALKASERVEGPTPDPREILGSRRENPEPKVSKTD